MQQIQFNVLKDAPVTEDDWLGRRAYAEQIASLIMHSRANTPFVIGIDGTWGTGKSSLMLMIDDELKKAKAQTVWFNAWMHQHKTNPAEGLVKTILLSLQFGLGRLPIRNLRLYWLFGRRIAVTLLRILVHALAGWAKVSNSVVDDIWRDFERDIELANAFRGKLEKVISKFTRKGGVLVVFVDDLDRCGPDAIIRIFEALKVYLEAKGLVFILGYDRGALVDCVQHRLVAEHAHQAINYLEKVVQIPYPVPVPTGDQIDQCLAHFLEVSNASSVFTEDLRPVIVEFSQTNPRRMKRFINSFALAHTLQLFGGDLHFQARMWLLWMYYRRLHTVFTQKLGETQRYMDYSELRMALDSADVDHLETHLATTLQQFVPLGSPERVLSREEVQQRLDRAVPPAFVDVYRDDNVRRLVRPLAEALAQMDAHERKAREREVIEQAKILDREPQLFESAVASNMPVTTKRSVPLIAFSDAVESTTLQEFLDSTISSVPEAVAFDRTILTAPVDLTLEYIEEKYAPEGRPFQRGAVVVTTDYLQHSVKAATEFAKITTKLLPLWHLVILGSDPEELAKQASQLWMGSVFTVQKEEDLTRILRSMASEL